MATTTEQDPHEQTDVSTLNWGPDAPRGGKAVMGRILKDNATVPLFFGQTMIQSLRDVGYNHTTSALCEHVDNAIQAGATEVRVYFRQRGKRGEYQIDAAVYDNGVGMSAAVLKVATSFGGSTTFGNRKGIGRFGMGMKTAALSMSPVMELYSCLRTPSLRWRRSRGRRQRWQLLPALPAAFVWNLTARNNEASSTDRRRTSMGSWLRSTRSSRSTHGEN